MYLYFEKKKKFIIPFYETLEKEFFEFIFLSLFLSLQQIDNNEIADTLDEDSFLNFCSKYGKCGYFFRILDVNNFDSVKFQVLVDSLDKLQEGYDILREYAPEEMNPQVLSSFVSTVKDNYNDLPFHNYDHGLGVARFASKLIKNLELIELDIFSKRDAFNYLVAAISHDLDHRGFSNSFYQKNSTWAEHFNTSKSLNEHHHLEVLMKILQHPETKVYKNHSYEEWMQAKQFIEHVILSSDLQNHFL